MGPSYGCGASSTDLCRWLMVAYKGTIGSTLDKSDTFDTLVGGSLHTV